MKFMESSSISSTSVRRFTTTISCPGITSLHAGDFDLGTVACDCPWAQEVSGIMRLSNRANAPFYR
jgi:hypothetical protein